MSSFSRKFARREARAARRARPGAIKGAAYTRPDESQQFTVSFSMGGPSADPFRDMPPEVDLLVRRIPKDIVDRFDITGTTFDPNDLLDPEKCAANEARHAEFQRAMAHVDHVPVTRDETGAIDVAALEAALSVASDDEPA